MRFAYCALPLRPPWNQPLPLRVSRSPWIEGGIVGGQLLAVTIDPDRRGSCRLPYRRPAVRVVVPLLAGCWVRLSLGAIVHKLVPGPLCPFTLRCHHLIGLIGALSITPSCVKRIWSGMHRLQSDSGEPIGVGIPDTILGTDERHHPVGPVEDIAVVNGSDVADHEPAHPPIGRRI